ncbi:hypothetical protein [Mesorhizobium erdmanii]|uniref:Uncharacterized protein n=1 Tax=Mesorhizobium erdmanii TaxID=1777866 RepID=A0A6M7ULE6_9HYPH|nr:MULTISPECIES: hypothetical protein [Mesorhizobium]QKC77924.1 hypothetical protein EB233_22490 [Mesorhizobium erdmanii]
MGSIPIQTSIFKSRPLRKPGGFLVRDASLAFLTVPVLLMAFAMPNDFGTHWWRRTLAIAWLAAGKT